MGLLLSLGAGAPAKAAHYEPHILLEVQERAQSVTEQGQTPVVIFDLDDTLINTRERNLRILRDLAAEPATLSRFPAAAERLAEIGPRNIRYLLKDTLATLQLTDEAFVEAANNYWLAHFFTNAYCAHDRPNPGAARYVRWLVNEGATVVYLTGRDTPRMGKGTASNLRELGFPIDGPKAILMMKPSAQGDDLAFKISRFQTIAQLGVVVAAFENEPANINAFQTGYPDALMIFLDTIHSPKPDTPNSMVHWVRDFEPDFR